MTYPSGAKRPTLTLQGPLTVALAKEPYIGTHSQPYMAISPATPPKRQGRRARRSHESVNEDVRVIANFPERTSEELLALGFRLFLVPRFQYLVDLPRRNRFYCRIDFMK
jgi:hypothetical protein